MHEGSSTSSLPPPSLPPPLQPPPPLAMSPMSVEGEAEAREGDSALEGRVLGPRDLAVRPELLAAVPELLSTAVHTMQT